MKYFLRNLFFSFLITLWGCGHAQDTSDSQGKLLYQTDFEEVEGLAEFFMTDQRAWRLAKSSEGNVALELFGESEYQPRVRSPRNIACIRDQKFGDFVWEFEAAQTGKEYGHRDMCFFFGMKDPSNFYYVHIASAADPHAHNIFLVNDEPRVAIAEKTTSGIDWGEQGSWHKIKIERELESGLIRVYFDDMDTPIMEAHDTHFGVGYIGFGSFDDTGMVDNIEIRGQEVSEKGEGFFE
ncbi:MAG: hypothetical protein AAF694_11110 [Bacteroidota bacterium]